MIDQYLDIKSIDPLYWGKCGWIFLNSIALTYNPEFKDKYKIFIEQLPHVLPCLSCGANLKKNMEQVQLDNALISKESFLLWLLKIRNDIYTEHNRPNKTLLDNINEIFAIKYFYTTENHIYIITCVLVILLILLMYVFKKYQ
jgi:hypothetical protein